FSSCKIDNVATSSPFTLAPTKAVVCTGSYTVTQADLNNNGGGDGAIANTATADSDQTTSTQDSAEAPLAPAPGLSIDKVVTGIGGDTTAPFDPADAAGDVITYRITASNTGNTTLTGVTV